MIDNVEFGLKMAGIEKTKRYEIAMNFLDMMQLKKFAEAFTYQLSGGMKQYTNKILRYQNVVIF